MSGNIRTRSGENWAFRGLISTHRGAPSSTATGSKSALTSSREGPTSSGRGRRGIAGSRPRAARQASRNSARAASKRSRGIDLYRPAGAPLPVGALPPELAHPPRERARRRAPGEHPRQPQLVGVELHLPRQVRDLRVGADQTRRRVGAARCVPPTKIGSSMVEGTAAA